MNTLSLKDDAASFRLLTIIYSDLVIQNKMIVVYDFLYNLIVRFRIVFYSDIDRSFFELMIF